ncbi:hypothetical protein [Streptomyces sp. NPDC101393]
MRVAPQRWRAEIARLAAATVRSREVAEVLPLSVRTVGNHL